MANFSCPSGEVFYTASIIWAAIGPRRILPGDVVHASLQHQWLIGGACPLVLRLLLEQWPKSPLRLINLPVILNGNAIPPGTPLNFMALFVVAAGGCDSTISSVTGSVANGSDSRTQCR